MSRGPKTYLTPSTGVGAGSRALVARVGVVVGVLAATALGVGGYVAIADPDFTLDQPRTAAPAAPGQGVPVGGQAGDLDASSLFVLTGEPASGGHELFTLGARPVVDEATGRWTGEVVAPEVDRSAAVSVVAVRADPLCGSQLAEMGADPVAGGRFFGPLPGGCAVLARAPLAVAGG